MHFKSSIITSCKKNQIKSKETLKCINVVQLSMLPMLQRQHANVLSVDEIILDTLKPKGDSTTDCKPCIYKIKNLFTNISTNLWQL